ncbi:hypothetical protein LWI28_025707 [Acer negundo]|uniref:Myb/SANT-like domain-containing protein n=1 Tax=Acer negundo TaxID=4023 RepID=A0AAD5IH70_ACENE|nr:hypothetical protein LWI28_025707 [Acer negundo]
MIFPVSALVPRWIDTQVPDIPKGPGQNKRFRTEEEDNKLIESLLELNNNGRFKAEGSFKPGHLKELEKNIHEKLPRCDLLAKPYIESRMKTLKTHFYIVHGILTGPNCSCFRWDIEKKTVTVEKHVWDAFIQSHKEVAPGQHGETPADVEEQLQNEEGDYNGDDNASSENVDNASDNNVVINLASKSSKRSQSQTDCSSTSKKQRKTKSSGDLAEALTESTATFAAVIEKSSARLSKAIGEDLNEKRILPDELKDDWAKGILAGTIYASVQPPLPRTTLTIFFNPTHHSSDPFLCLSVLSFNSNLNIGRRRINESSSNLFLRDGSCKNGANQHLPRSRAAISR